MAQTQMGQIDLGFVAKNNSDGTAGTADVGSPLSYASVSAMRTRLATISASLYTSAELDRMSVNDMIYALRVNDDPGTI